MSPYVAIKRLQVGKAFKKDFDDQAMHTIVFPYFSFSNYHDFKISHFV